jgi:hypothetical protein
MVEVTSFKLLKYSGLPLLKNFHESLAINEYVLVDFNIENV